MLTEYSGERHSLLLSKEGNVYSFGDGSMGQVLSLLALLVQRCKY